MFSSVEPAIFSHHYRMSQGISHNYHPYSSNTHKSPVPPIFSCSPTQNLHFVVLAEGHMPSVKRRQLLSHLHPAVGGAIRRLQRPSAVVDASAGRRQEGEEDANAENTTVWGRDHYGRCHDRRIIGLSDYIIGFIFQNYGLLHGRDRSLEVVPGKDAHLHVDSAVQNSSCLPGSFTARDHLAKCRLQPQKTKDEGQTLPSKPTIHFWFHF